MTFKNDDGLAGFSSAARAPDRPFRAPDPAVDISLILLRGKSNAAAILR
jgi:hypothetical protein